MLGHKLTNMSKNQLWENRNLSQQGTVLKMSQKSDGKLISKPVDAQLFNVDLSSVPLPPAAAAAETVVEDTSFSSQNQTVAFTKKKYNDECNSSKSMSNILPPSSLSSTSSSSTTTRIHLPFTSSGLSLSSDVSQISTTSVPQPVPPPVSMPMTSVSTLPPLPLTPVPPVPPPPVLPATPSLDLSNFQTQIMVQHNNSNNVVSSSTPYIDSMDKETTHSMKKDTIDITKSLSSPDAQKDSKSDKNHILAKTPNRITRFSLKSPDGGGKPKVSFQIKRKNRPIVGDKTESIVEEEDVINSNPGQFVTRKREMFKPAEVESVAAQQIALIKSLGILENVQKKAQTSPTGLETEPSLLTTDRTSPSDKTVDKTLLNKVSDKISEISLLGKEEEKQSLDDKSQEIANEKCTPEKVREQFSHETSQENSNITNDKPKEVTPHGSPSENLNKEKFTEKPVSEKSVNITPEKSHEPSSSTNQSRGKSTRDRSSDHSSLERTHDRSTRDKYDKNSDKSRDRNTHDRSGRDSSHDRSIRGQSYERGGREKSQDRSRDWERSRDRSTRDRSRERSYDRSSRDRRDRSNRDRSNRDRSRDRSTRDRSRERSTRGRSRDRYMREKSYERSPDERSLSDKPSDHIKNRSDNSYDYRNSQRRFNTRERRSRWSERYDDNRYSRTSDRYKRDTYDNRISSHYYDDDYYNRSHYEDKRSRYDDRPFYSQDKHQRSDDVYSDRYDRRNRRGFHPSEDKVSDIDSSLKDSSSPIRHSFTGTKSSSIGSGINAISVHYSQASDSDSSPVHNLDGMKQYNQLQYSSSSVVVSSTSTVPTNQLPVFGQEHQIQNYSNKLDECSTATNYNYGDSTPVRDEPNDYEFNFAQNSTPVNSYQGFGNLYQPNTSAMNWLAPPLEPAQDIDVSQRINSTTTIPTVLGDNSSYPSVLNTSMQQKEHASIVPITLASQNIADPSRINMNISNAVTEHRIPTLLKDFPKITHNNNSTQNFALTSNVNQLNLSSVSTSTVSLNSNINLNPCLPNSVGLPPVAISHLPPPPPPPPLPLPAESNANFLTRPYEVKLENSSYNVLSNYASSKTPSQSQPVIHSSNKDFSSSQKEQLQAVTSIAIADITVGSFSDSKVSLTSQSTVQKPVAQISYSADKLHVADSITQSPKIDSCHKPGLENQLLTSGISVKSTDSSAEDYNKYFSLISKQTSQMKTVDEPALPVTNLALEHVPIIESSHIIEPAETKQRTLVSSHLGEAEVSSSDYLLTEQSTKLAVKTEQPSLEQCIPDSDCTDQKKGKINETDIKNESQEKRVPAVVNTTDSLCLKDNFEEELMEVDSPESSCYIETNFNMSSAPNDNQGQTADNRDDRSIISTSCSNSQIQDIQTEVPHGKTENKVYLKSDCKVTDSSTLSNRENEISSSDMQKTSCDILNSENTITTTGNEEKIKFSSPDLSNSVTISKYSESSRQASTDNKHIKFQHVIRSITTDTTYSVDVTSSDEKFPKINKPKFHALQKDRQNIPKLDTLSPKNTSQIISSGKEIKSVKVSGSRPTSRWDVSNPSQSKNSDIAKSSSVATSSEVQSSKLLNQNIFEIIGESKNIFQKDSQNLVSVTNTKVGQVSVLKESETVKEQTISVFHESLESEYQDKVSKSQLPSVKKEEKLKVEPILEQPFKDTVLLETQEPVNVELSKVNKLNESKEPTVLSSNEVSVNSSDQLKGKKEENTEVAAEQTNEEELLARNVDTVSSKTEQASEISVSEDTAECSTLAETSVRNEDCSSKDEGIESPNQEKSVKGSKRSESVSQTCLTPAPRRSGRIRSLEEKRVREKEGKKEKDCRTKKDKKEVKTDKEAEDKEKLVHEDKNIDDPGTKDNSIKEELAKEADERKEREGRRTRNRASNKEEEDLKEEMDKKRRDLNNRQVKEDTKKVTEIAKEKPKRLTRNKKLLEPEKTKSDQIGSENEIKQDECEAAILNVASDCSQTDTTSSNSVSQIKKPSAVTSSYSLNPTQNSASSLQKDSFQTTPTTTDQPAINKETKKEDSLTSSRPLKVKSRWRKTMEAEWLSASAHISSTSTDLSSSVSTTIPTTLSPQISPSLQTLPSAAIVTSLPSLPQTLSSPSLPSSSCAQPSDLTVPLGSQASIHQTQPTTLLQQATPSSLQQPSIQISSSQISPQQKCQPVVSTTFQSSDEILISSKTASANSSIIEDHRKSYLQKPTVDTILEEEEEEEVEGERKNKDVTLQEDVANLVPSSIKDTPSRPDVEANKENDGSYEEITDNIYLTERKKSKQMREVRRMVCDCTINPEDRDANLDACGEDCLNRMLMIECGSRCPCGEYCNNKRFTRHQYVNVTTFQTENKGLGLMTLEDVLPHTFVMEYVGEVLDYKQFKNRTKQYAKNGQEHYYFMSLNADEVIDATYRGNKSRFINHSCDPNCETQKWTVNGMLRIGFFTKTFISAGQEMTFDYQFESKQAQKCHCGSSCCRGTIGGKKKSTVKSKKKSVSSEKKKKEFEDESLEEEMERMSQLEGLKNKEHVLNLCRLMVRAESNDHRLSILRILQGTNEQACLRLFLDYHGLPLLWSWMADIGDGAPYLKLQILDTLKMLPITNKTILQESKILPMVLKWATELKLTADPEIETEQSNDNSSQAGTPSSVASRDERPPKKKVKFADETSSDSEMSECSRLSGMIYVNEPTTKNGLNEVADSSDMTYTDYSTPGGNLYIDDLDETRSSKSPSSGVPKSGILIKPELQKELSSESSSSPVVDDKIQSNEAESSSPDILEKSTKEKSEDDTLTKDDDSSNEVKVAADEKNFDSSKLSSVVSLATDLLKHWSDLKEVFKIPKKEKVEERKRTERELGKDRKRRYEASPDKNHNRFRTRSDRRRDDVQELLNPNRPRIYGFNRRVLLPTPPKLSKEERRQQFEAQVRAEDERAEFQKQQEAAYIQQQQEYMQQYNISGEGNGYDYYAQHDPNIAYQQDPNMVYQHDPNVAYTQDPSAVVAYQADPVTGMFPNPATYPQDPNAQYQDPNSVYHLSNYLIPPPTDPAAYAVSTADPAVYPVPPPTDPNAYQIHPTDPNAYQIQPPDANAYSVTPTDPNAYQVPAPEQTTFQTTTEQTSYQTESNNYQISVPPPVTPVPAEPSYPKPSVAVTAATSPAVTQQPSVAEALSEHCFMPAPSVPVVLETGTPQTTPNHSVLPTMTPTYIEPGSSVPTLYSNTPAFSVQSKYMTTPQTSQTTSYPQTTPPQSSTLPQLPPQPPQLPAASLVNVPPPTPSSTPQTPLFVQGQQGQPPQQPPAAPPQVFYPPTPQALVVPPPQHFSQPQASTPAVASSQVVQINQGLFACQQVDQLQQLQMQNIVLPSTTSTNAATDDEPPPPPSPPKPKVTKLPANWKIAKDAEGKQYYYHTLTRQTQWDLPKWDQSDQDDMDLGTPTHDEPQNKTSDLFFQSKRKATTTAAADTSSELAKRSKEAFRNKMSQWIVACLNPYRKPDCRLGRISSTDDFKHLARKLTHHVMAKELKHCKHPEDLEVNENVKAKAKDYIKKYMCKFGANYKKAQSPTPDD
ncbi:histone-lysine N-methyltransferase SETD2-like isoform X3 [Octopus vulgaris]|uniref:[histone H3]-lysine(36) N-trimethyltransferase n=1 Tax=Octopus vulgaris TaxID=6645 RepID=A0AA36AI76_OCTVU|nr:histone-lysine N-methyltransferase SETD2-like isoform X3 [Octopus vulgaris]